MLFSTVVMTCSAVVSPSIPNRGMVRTIGVDFGLRRVGVAISSGIASLPLRVLPCGGGSIDDFQMVAQLVAKIAAGEGATQVVVGMPYNSTGGEGEQAVITRKFAAVLADRVAPSPVFLWDERFSSAEASMRMNGGRGASKGEVLDAVAAAVILDDFFAADDSADEAAIHIPSTIVAPVSSDAGAKRPVVKLPVPPSASEVRRKMVERAAREAAAIDDVRRSKNRKVLRRSSGSGGSGRGGDGTCASSGGAQPTDGQGATSESKSDSRRRGLNSPKRRIDRFNIE